MFIYIYIGFLRDMSGNFVLCIYFMNVITAVCLAMWTCELVYIRCKHTRKVDK